MSADLIAGILNERFGFDFAPEHVQYTAATEASKLFLASNEEGAAVEVELFDAHSAPAADSDLNTLNNALAQSTHPGVFQPRSVGRTDDGRLFVLREAPTGAPLMKLITEKRTEGSLFTKAEARDLLQAVAEAIDAYNASGNGSFVARSVDPARMLVQPAWSAVPVKMSLVGPTPVAQPAPETVEDLELQAANVAGFVEVLSSMIGEDVDEQIAQRTRTCAGYLNAVAGVAGPEAPPADDAPEVVGAVAPRPQDGYRKPPEPYQYGPSGEYTRPEEKKSAPWPWIAGIVVLLLIAGAALWYWANNRGEQWAGVEAEIAQTYPGIVSEKAGQKGWQDLRCESAIPEQGQEGKIRCANEDLGVSVAKYVSADARDRVVPPAREAVVLGSGECMIYDFALPNAYPPAFVMTPQAQSQYMVIINGEQAEEMRLDLPLCE